MTNFAKNVLICVLSLVFAVSICFSVLAVTRAGAAKGLTDTVFSVSDGSLTNSYGKVGRITTVSTFETTGFTLEIDMKVIRKGMGFYIGDKQQYYFRVETEGQQPGIMITSREKQISTYYNRFTGVDFKEGDNIRVQLIFDGTSLSFKINGTPLTAKVSGTQLNDVSFSGVPVTNTADSTLQMLKYREFTSFIGATNPADPNAQDNAISLKKTKITVAADSLDQAQINYIKLTKTAGSVVLFNEQFDALDGSVWYSDDEVKIDNGTIVIPRHFDGEMKTDAAVLKNGGKIAFRVKPLYGTTTVNFGGKSVAIDAGSGMVTVGQSSNPVALSYGEWYDFSVAISGTTATVKMGENDLGTITGVTVPANVAFAFTGDDSAALDYFYVYEGETLVTEDDFGYINGEFWDGISSMDLDLATIMEPIWSGTVSYEETVWPVKNDHGTIDPIKLLYPIQSILKVTSTDGNTVYTAGVDYKVEDGNFVVPSGSSIPVTEFSAYWGNFWSAVATDPYAYGVYNADNHWEEKQVKITYTHEAAEVVTTPKTKGNLLPNTLNKLENGETLRVVTFGDSITEGASVSGHLGVAPKMKRWSFLVEDTLSALYPAANVILQDSGFGGTGTGYAIAGHGGFENSANKSPIYNYVMQYHPDLVVVAFGMNDSGTSAWYYDAAFYSILIAKLKELCPETEFILVAPMLCSIYQRTMWENVNGAPNCLLGMSRYFANYETDGVAFCNITSLHEEMLGLTDKKVTDQGEYRLTTWQESRKNYRDTSANNYNHPNDYMGRVYAQAIVKTITARTITNNKEEDRNEGVLDHTGNVVADGNFANAFTYSNTAPSEIDAGKYAGYVPDGVTWSVKTENNYGSQLSVNTSDGTGALTCVQTATSKNSWMATAFNVEEGKEYEFSFMLKYNNVSFSGANYAFLVQDSLNIDQTTAFYALSEGSSDWKSYKLRFTATSSKYYFTIKLYGVIGTVIIDNVRCVSMTSDLITDGEFKNQTGFSETIPFSGTNVWGGWSGNLSSREFTGNADSYYCEDGTGALKVVAASGNGNFGTAIPVVEGTEYLVSFYARAGVDEKGNSLVKTGFQSVSIYGQDYNVDNGAGLIATYQGIGNGAEVPTKYTKFSAKFTAPKTGWAFLVFKCNGLNGTIYIDEVHAVTTSTLTIKDDKASRHFNYNETVKDLLAPEENVIMTSQTASYSAASAPISVAVTYSKDGSTYQDAFTVSEPGSYDLYVKFTQGTKTCVKQTKFNVAAPAATDILFKINGEEVTEYTKKDVNLGDMITLPAYNEKFCTKRFDGWSDGLEVYPAGASYQVMRSDVEFNAVFSELKVGEIFYSDFSSAIGMDQGYSPMSHTLEGGKLHISAKNGGVFFYYKEIALSKGVTYTLSAKYDFTNLSISGSDTGLIGIAKTHNGDGQACADASNVIAQLFRAHATTAATKNSNFKDSVTFTPEKDGTYELIVVFWGAQSLEFYLDDLKVSGYTTDGHVPATAVEENRVEATCVKNGSYDEVVYCSVCGKEISRTAKIISSAGAQHDIQNHSAKAPTCEEVGWDAYETCSKCTYSTYSEISALGHLFEATNVEVVWEGYTATVTCSREGCDNVTVCYLDMTETILEEPACEEEGSRNVTATAYLGENLFANGRVEAADKMPTYAGWQSEVKASFGKESHLSDGTGSFRVVNPLGGFGGNDENGNVYFPLGELEANAKYTLMFWYKATNVTKKSGFDGHFWITTSTSADNPTAPDEFMIVPDSMTDWKKVQYTFTANTSVPYYFLFKHNSYCFDEMLFDDIALIKSDGTNFADVDSTELPVPEAGHNYVDGVCSVCGELNASVSAYDLRPASELVLYTYLQLDPAFVKEGSKYVVKVTKNGQDFDEIPLEGLEPTEFGDYEFFCTFYAKEMTVDAQFTVTDGTNTKAFDAVSVQDYAALYLDQGKNDKGEKLVKAMLNYGAACQICFDYKADDLANAILENEDKIVSVDPKDISVTTEETDLAADDYLAEGLQYKGMGLFVEETLVLSLKMQLVNIGTAQKPQYLDLTGYTLSVEFTDGEAVSLTDAIVGIDETGLCTVEIEHIPSRLADAVFTVKFTKDQEVIAIPRSVNFYVKNVLSSLDATNAQKATVAALYCYGEASKEFNATPAE